MPTWAVVGGKLLGHLSEGAKTAGSVIRAGWRLARHAIAQQFRTARQWLTFIWRLRGPVLLALGAGGAIGLAC
jgi:hypothetical protein